MANKNLAKIFKEMAVFLEMQGTAFKPQAYQRAALEIEGLDKNIKNIYQEKGTKGLEEIPGIGKNLAEKIKEYLETNKIASYEKLKRTMPVNLDELMAVEGIGPKTIKILWSELKIKDVKGLEKAARAGKIRILPNFGEKAESNILQAVRFFKKSRGRFLLGEMLPGVREIILKLKVLKEVKIVSLAGSLRRGKETIGDADIVAVSKNPGKVIGFFVSLPDIIRIWGQGKTKASVRMKQGFDVDLRIVPEKSYGSAQQYFTGSKEHNIALRTRAMEKGLKLNEYGIFQGKKMIAGRKEKDIYRALGLAFIEPELRENKGEIEAGQNNVLPKLVKAKDILGDLHCHTLWNGGENTILEMAWAAKARGCKYLGIADHTKFLKIEKGLDEKQLLRQGKEIGRLNKKFSQQGIDFKILHGCEANILKDGSIDIGNDVLAKLDYVIAGVHSAMKMTKPEMTKRIIKAMQNPHVDIISHPTGRILKKRDEYEIDFKEILKIAGKTNTVLEINSSPFRLDLKDSNIRLAKEAGVKMAVNADAHNIGQLQLIDFGIVQARRGWAEKADIINCWSAAKLLDFFQTKAAF